MAIKWGGTYVTAVKWGNTTCTKVYWGGTLVFPTGGWDGSSFSYPLNGGFIRRGGGVPDNSESFFDYNGGTDITSLSYTFGMSRASSGGYKVHYLIASKTAINTTNYSSCKVYGTATVSNINNNFRIMICSTNPAVDRVSISSYKNITYATETTLDSSFISSLNGKYLMIGLYAYRETTDYQVYINVTKLEFS